MKKIILTVLTIITILGLKAQGNNLQFNQVLNYEYTHGVIGVNLLQSWFNVGLITVPPNKVYKITSGSIHIATSSKFFFDFGAIKVGEHLVSGGENDSHINNCPIWLGTGTYNVSLAYSNSGQVLYGALSIIEFNIVP